MNEDELEDPELTVIEPNAAPIPRRKNAPVLFTRRRIKQKVFTYHMEATVIASGDKIQWVSAGLEDLMGLRQTQHPPSSLTAVHVLKKL